MVSHKYKCIFIHIPKTGGETVASLFDNEDSNIPKHANARQIKSFLGEKVWAKYFKFTVVRNPYDMAVSMYSHLRKPLYQQEVIKKKYGKKVLNPVKACATACNNSFKNYCVEVFKEKQVQDEELRQSWPVSYFQNQTDWITVDQDKIKLDFVIRYENLNKDLSYVLDNLNITYTEIPNKNISKHNHYSKYYTKQTKNIVAQHYQKDLEYLEYFFEDEKNLFDKIKILFKQ